MRVMVFAERTWQLYEVTLKFTKLDDSTSFSRLVLVAEQATDSEIIEIAYDSKHRLWVVCLEDGKVQGIDMKGQLVYEVGLGFKPAGMSINRKSVVVLSRSKLARLDGGVVVDLCDGLQISADVRSVLASDEALFQVLLVDGSLVTIHNCRGKVESVISHVLADPPYSKFTSSDTGLFLLSSAGFLPTESRTRSFSKVELDRSPSTKVLQFISQHSLMEAEAIDRHMWSFQGQATHCEISSFSDLYVAVVAISLDNKLMIFSKSLPQEPEFEELLRTSYVRMLGYGLSRFLLAVLTIAIWRYSNKKQSSAASVDQVLANKQKLERKMKKAQHLHQQIRRRLEKQQHDLGIS